MPLRFHWMLPKAGEVNAGASQTPQEAARYRLGAVDPNSSAARTDMEGWTSFARHAEEAGIDSVLISLSRYEPDPLLISCALGQAVSKLKFISAYRSGLLKPTSFVQQINSLSALIDGRVAINIVAGSSTTEQRSYGDFLPHDERYERTEEFLAVCNAFWRNNGEVDFDGKHYRVEKGRLSTPFVAPDRRSPEIYVSGHSANAEKLAEAQGTCLLRVADAPDKLRPSVMRARENGLEVCLRFCVVCRPAREEAIRVAESLLPKHDIPQTHRSIAAKDDSQMYREASNLAAGKDKWLTHSLWAGLAPYYGPVWTALLGTPREIADALLEYKEIGVTQFIISGWPEVDEVINFGREVIPLVRQAEGSERSS